MHLVIITSGKVSDKYFNREDDVFNGYYPYSASKVCTVIEGNRIVLNYLREAIIYYK